MKKLPFVNWGLWICKPIIRTYPNGRPAIELVNVETYEPVAVVTVNLTDHYPPAGHVFIKNHDGIQRGLIPALVKAGVTSDVVEEVPYGPYNSTAYLVKLTMNEEDAYEGADS